MKSGQEIIIEAHRGNPRAIGRAITIVENGGDLADEILRGLDDERLAKAMVIGLTGPPGAGKSTLTSALVGYCRQQGERLGVVAIDPSSAISGGAILGDRIRMMPHALDPDVVIRSMATRGRLGGLCGAAGAAMRIMAHSGCQRILVETVGVGQSEIDIIRQADLTLMVMAPGLGDDIQAMKAGLLELVDVLVVNKADLRGADTLYAEMLAVVRERGVRPGHIAKLCQTVALTGFGLEELVGIVDELAIDLNNRGEKVKRRQKSQQLEIIDWGLEFLRPKLAKLVADEGDLDGEPRLLARKILEKIIK